ncbi:MAG: hypothetical protein OEW04_03525 [Nitrospirota bacterium]|nr:hypothetical protein [Nitrospirota bacterium]
MFSSVIWYCTFFYRHTVVSFMEWRVKQLRKKYFIAEEVRRKEAAAFRANYTALMEAAERMVPLIAAEKDPSKIEQMLKDGFTQAIK